MRTKSIYHLFVKNFCKKYDHLFRDYEELTPVKRLGMELSLKYGIDLINIPLNLLDELIKQKDLDLFKDVAKNGSKFERPETYARTLFASIFYFEDDEITKNIDNFVEKSIEQRIKKTLH